MSHSCNSCKSIKNDTHLDVLRPNPIKLFLWFFGITTCVGAAFLPKGNEQKEIRGGINNESSSESNTKNETMNEPNRQQKTKDESSREDEKYVDNLAGSKLLIKTFKPHNFVGGSNSLQFKPFNAPNNGKITSDDEIGHGYVEKNNIGCCTALSGDGLWMVSGAKNQIGIDLNGSVITCGAVYVYRLTQSSSVESSSQYKWLQYGAPLQVIKDEACLFQGSCVSINGNGTIIAFSGQSPLEGNKRINEQHAGNQETETIFVFTRDDEKKCFVQDFSTQDLLQEPELRHSRISCMKLDYSGNILVIGQPFYNKGQGIVTVCFYDGDKWLSSPVPLFPPVSLSSHILNNNIFHFGWSVDISADGNLILIGAPTINKLVGAAYVFEWKSIESMTESNSKALHNHKDVDGHYQFKSSLNPRKIQDCRAGISVATNKTGSICFVYAPNSSIGPQVFVYRKDKTAFVLQTTIQVCKSFGPVTGSYHLTCNDSGNLLAVGYDSYLDKQGCVQLFQFQEEINEWRQSQLIEKSKTHTEHNTQVDNVDNAYGRDAHFGACVSFNSDGTKLLIGAPLDDGGQGGNYYYIS